MGRVAKIAKPVAKKTAKNLRRSSGSLKRASAFNESGEIEVIEAAPLKASRPRTKKQVREYEELILNHRESGRKLSRSLLRRWRVTMPAEEVDSVVDLTLCEAAIRYDKTKGASFITFFFYHLRGHLVRAVTAATADSNMAKAIAAGAGVEPQDWASLGEEIWSLLPELEESLQRDAESPESSLLTKEKQLICSGACSKLDALEREIIERSYVQDEPLVDIARSLGYSRCHISRVKRRALERLRDELVQRSALEVIDFDPDFSALDDEEQAPKRRRRRRSRDTQAPLRIAA